MRILIVDSKAESQTAIASLFHNLDPEDIESLDIHVHLTGPDQMIKRLQDVDILILGPDLGDQASSLARSAKASVASVEVIMFVSEQAYRGGAFRFARSAKARKVFPANCDPLDLLQELVNIHSEFCEGGRVKSGSLTVVAQAKGGVGATTICAALGELCNEHQQHSLLWDGDIESRDLTRSLMSDGSPAMVINDFVEGRRDVNRDSLRDAVVTVGKYVRLLPPPSTTAAACDFVGHPDCVNLSQRIVDLSRLTYQNVLFDTGGRLGPTTGMLMRAADNVVIVADDSVMGMMAFNSFLDSVLPLLPHRENVWVLCSGARLPIEEIREIVDPDDRLPDSAWTLPVLPYDSNAGVWPGSGKTLYSHGGNSTRDALHRVAHTLDLVDHTHSGGRKSNFRISVSRQRNNAEPSASPGLMKRVLNLSFSSH